MGILINGIEQIRPELSVVQADLDNPAQYMADLSTLELRLSAARAGYLDELDFDLQGLLNTIAAYLTTEIADILTDTGSTLPGLLSTIQTDLDNPSQYMANLTTLETRLSAVRAGYLDQLDFALQEAIADIKTILDTPANFMADITAVTVDSRTTAYNRLTGVKQIIEFSITAAANSGDQLLATITTEPCLIESIVLTADAAQTVDMTSVALRGGSGNVITFIDVLDAQQADLDAIDKQVYWTGAVRLLVARQIRIDLQGTGATAVDLTVTVTFRACVDGGYLL